MALWKIIPPEEGNDFCHRLVYHGREVCTARTTPYCDKCVLRDVCKEYPKLEKLKTQKAKRAQAAKTTAANKGKSGKTKKEKK
jgi:endonuclease-3